MSAWVASWALPGPQLCDWDSYMTCPALSVLLCDPGTTLEAFSQDAVKTKTYKAMRTGPARVVLVSTDLSGMGTWLQPPGPP